jgi:hypothetical protein
MCACGILGTYPQIGKSRKRRYEKSPRKWDQIMGTDGGVVGTGQGVHPPTETEGKQDLSTQAWCGAETDTAAPGIWKPSLYVLRTGIQWKALPKA